MTAAAGFSPATAEPSAAAETPPWRAARALDRLLEALGAVRNGGAVYVLLASFAIAGMLLALGEAAFARQATVLGVVEAGLALTVAFYGGNAAGLLVMDQARGRPVREGAAAVKDALGSAHRLLGVLLIALLGVGTALALLIGLLWLCRLPALGPWLFGLVVPVGVIATGAVALATAAVVAPLAAPATWGGLGLVATLRFLARQVRRRLLWAALLVAGASGLAAAVAALVSFAVMAGGRGVSWLAVWILNVDLPPQQLMAGLFGYGLRSLGAAGAPVAQNPYGAAALIGGGVVFALALVLPGVVYMGGLCAAYLSLEEADRLAASV
jgi:hypothetical protein